MSKKLALWSFEGKDHNLESLDSMPHPDHGHGGEGEKAESIFMDNKDHREQVPEAQFADGGTCRCKLNFFS